MEQRGTGWTKRKEGGLSEQALFVWVMCGVQVGMRVSVLNRTMETLLFFETEANGVIESTVIAKAILSLALSLFF